MTATTSTAAGPQRAGGQGIDRHQETSANRAIHELLTSETGHKHTDWVATWREGEPGGEGAYEVWAERGMVRWVRRLAEGGGYRYDVVEVVGENPIGAQDYRALSTLDEEIAAGRDTGDPQRAYVEPERLTYPFAYERISALFDSPNAPDLIVNPRSWAYGRQPGQHGALDVIQSRSPLVFSGPGIRRGETVDAAARQVDVAPTIARAMGFPLIDGRDETGRTSGERGVAPDVYLAWQDGRVLTGVLDDGGEVPERTIILLLDGQSHTELFHRIESEPRSIPHLRRLIEGGTALRFGSTTNYPSITWPSHNTIGTAAWSGHHDIVNPTYYLRETRETVSPQGQTFDTAKFLGEGVETLYEAFHRVYGTWNGGTSGAFTASVNEPCTRGADHAALERRLAGDRASLLALTNETVGDINPRWREELAGTSHEFTGEIDNRALGQVRQLLLDENLPAPRFMYIELQLTDAAGHDYGPHHEAARQALDETDVRIGRILEILDAQGRFDSTLFVITTDHGMAIQDVEANANPARIPERAGLACVTTEPCIYLRDLRVGLTVSHDGRTGHLEVCDNDADAAGSRAPIAGAAYTVRDADGRTVASGTTDGAGVAGFALPVDLDPGDMRIAITCDGFNERQLGLDGTNVAIDLREALYRS